MPSLDELNAIGAKWDTKPKMSAPNTLDLMNEIGSKYDTPVQRDPMPANNDTTRGIKEMLHSGPTRGKFYPQMGGRPIDMPGNVLRGLASTMQGFGIQAAAPYGNIIQRYIPQDYAKNPNDHNPLTSGFGQFAGNVIAPGLGDTFLPNTSAGTLPLFRKGDMERGKQALQETWNDFNKNTAKPIFRSLKFDENSGNEFNDYRQRFVEDPLKHGSEILGAADVVGGIATLGARGAMGVARRAAPNLTKEVSGKLAPKIEAMGQAKEDFLDRVPFLGGARLQEHTKKIVQRKEGEITDRGMEVHGKIMDAQGKVLYQQDLIPGLEQSDNVRTKWMQTNPEAKNFHDTVAPMQSEYEKFLLDNGYSSAEDLGIARRGEQVRKDNPHFNRDEDLRSPEGAAAIAASEAAPGPAPVAVPRLYPKALDTFDKDFAENPMGRAGQVPHPERLTGRVGTRAEKKYSNDAGRSISQAQREFIQLKATQELLHELRTDPRILRATSAKGQKIVNAADTVREFERQVAVAAGYDPHKVEAFRRLKGAIQNEFMVPESVHLALQKTLASMNGPTIWHKVVSHYKYEMLARDPLFAARQGAQNVMIANAMMWRGPNDVIESALAIGLVATGQAKKILPKDILDNVSGDAIHEVGVATTAPKSMAVRTAGLINKIADKNLGAVNFVDSLGNELAGAYASLRLAKEEARTHKVGLLQGPAGVGSLLKRATNLEDASRNIEILLKDPVLRGKVYEEVHKWYGDYTPFARRNGRALETIMPFSRWNNHALRLFAAFTFDTKWKSMFQQHFTRVAPGVYQPNDMSTFYKNLGAVPVRDGEDKPVYVIENGKRVPLYTMRPQFHPLSQAIQIGQQLATFGSGAQPEAGEVVAPPLNPLVTGGVRAGGFDPGTMKTIKDPDDYGNSSKRWNKQGERQTFSAPGAFGAVMGAMYPRYFRPLAELLNTGPKGGRASSMTVPGLQHKYARDYKGNPLPPKPVDEIFKSAFGVGFTKGTISASDERKINKADKRQFKKTKSRQKGMRKQPQSAIPGLDDAGREVFGVF